ncbi:MAG: general secretion pathway protein GspB [Desulfobacterales bacterium]|nr:general secretion pathway protein GspB [Desulfobacterales bacterium]
MTRREKIILLIMAMVVVYGGYLLFVPPADIEEYPAGDTAELKEVKRIVVDAAAELRDNDLSRAEVHAIARAESGWIRDDLFVDRPQPRPADTDAGVGNPLAADFLYSGFLQVGKVRMAIINGLEYRSGETIEPGDFIIRSILPRKVVIEMTGQHPDFASFPPESRRILVPLAE